MNSEDRREVELVVRQFFDHYLGEVFPEQLAQMIAAHDNDVRAHTRQIRDAVKAESSRVKLWLWGIIFTGGVGGGIGVSRIVAYLAGN